MTDAASDPVQYSSEGDVAIVTLDDGKANVLTHTVIDGLQAAFAHAETDAKALVLAGRAGRFSAGFDLTTMSESNDSAQRLLGHGAELFFQSYMLGIPVVAAASGHALAAGAVMLLSTDVRIGEDVPCKIGLNEVAIGMALPRFIVELARDRLSKRHLSGLNLAKIYDAPGALDAGYLDEVVDPGASTERAVAVAAELAASLHLPSFRATRQHLRGATHERCRATLADDLAGFAVG